MSKARLVITAVTVEKRPVSEVARAYGVARSWIYALLARYQAEGDAAFEPRSRRQRTLAIGAGQGLRGGMGQAAWAGPVPSGSGSGMRQRVTSKPRDPSLPTWWAIWRRVSRWRS
jgi:Helix-turn-helix domain